MAEVTVTDPKVTHSEPTATVEVHEAFGRSTQYRFRTTLIGNDRVEIYNHQQSATWRMSREIAEGLRDALTRVLDATDGSDA